MEIEELIGQIVENKTREGVEKALRNISNESRYITGWDNIEKALSKCRKEIQRLSRKGYYIYNGEKVLAYDRTTAILDLKMLHQMLGTN